MLTQSGSATIKAMAHVVQFKEPGSDTAYKTFTYLGVNKRATCAPNADRKELPRLSEEV